MSKVIEEGCVEGEEYLNVFMVRKRVSVLCLASYMQSGDSLGSYMQSEVCRPTVYAAQQARCRAVTP